MERIRQLHFLKRDRDAESGGGRRRVEINHVKSLPPL
jgi:hypothetical protein